MIAVNCLGFASHQQMWMTVCPCLRWPRDSLASSLGIEAIFLQALRHTLKQQGEELITKLRKNMKPKLLNLTDKILLRKRALIETVNDQLKNVYQIEHSRHRSPINAFVHLIAGLVTFTWQEKRPALSWTPEEQEILNAHKQLVCA